MVQLLIEAGDVEEALTFTDLDNGLAPSKVAGVPRQPKGEASANRLTIVFQTLHGGSLSCWAISGAETRHWVVPARDWYAYTETAAELGLSLAGKTDEALVELGAVLLGPAEELILSANRVVVVPDGLTFRLPFSALVVGGRHLVELVQVVVSRSLLELGEAGAMATHRSASGRSLLVTVSEAGQAESLPGAEREGAWLAEQIAVADHLANREATLDRVTALLEEATLFHFSGHASADRQDPRKSALVLSGDDRLTAERIADLDLSDLELVILAGCDTGIDLRSEEGTSLGIARAFLEAGAKAVVMTLQAVDDGSTFTLSRDFYGYYLGGLSPGEALRSAQLAAIDSGQLLSAWAPFVLVEKGRSE